LMASIRNSLLSLLSRSPFHLSPLSRLSSSARFVLT
jgi:hypothetical protein